MSAQREYTQSAPRGTPEGWHRIEAWTEVFVSDDGSSIVVTGKPSDAHNCDAMGCGSALNHVVLRGTFAEDQP